MIIIYPDTHSDLLFMFACAGARARWRKGKGRDSPKRRRTHGGRS